LDAKKRYLFLKRTVIMVYIFKEDNYHVEKI